jgi:hypothetical protein
MCGRRLKINTVSGRRWHRRMDAKRTRFPKRRGLVRQIDDD